MTERLCRCIYSMVWWRVVTIVANKTKSVDKSNKCDEGTRIAQSENDFIKQGAGAAQYEFEGIELNKSA